MTFYEWLLAVKLSIVAIGPDHARREYVTGLKRFDKLYHFDDDAHEIVCGFDRSPVADIQTFSFEEAELVNEITNTLYHEDMFILALQELEIA